MPGLLTLFLSGRHATRGVRPEASITLRTFQKIDQHTPVPLILGIDRQMLILELIIPRYLLFRIIGQSNSIVNDFAYRIHSVLYLRLQLLHKLRLGLLQDDVMILLLETELRHLFISHDSVQLKLCRLADLNIVDLSIADRL